MTRLTTVPDPPAAAERTASVLARLLSGALSARGSAHIALNGGNSPRGTYERLPGLLEDWSAVHLWFGDERCVGPDDPESNFAMVRDTLLQAPGPASAVVHRMRGEEGPERAAEQYAAELAEHVPADDEGIVVLDVAFLGLGEDGHTASLFPGHDEVRLTGALSLPVRGAPKPPPERVTLSLDVLCAARQCVLIATGEGKRDALTAVLAGPDPRVPASLLPRSRLEIIADDAAHPGR